MFLSLFNNSSLAYLLLIKSQIITAENYSSLPTNNNLTVSLIVYSTFSDFNAIEEMAIMQNPLQLSVINPDNKFLKVKCVGDSPVIKNAQLNVIKLKSKKWIQSKRKSRTKVSSYYTHFTSKKPVPHWSTFPFQCWCCWWTTWGSWKLVPLVVFYTVGGRSFFFSCNFAQILPAEIQPRMKNDFSLTRFLLWENEGQIGVVSFLRPEVLRWTSSDLKTPLPWWRCGHCRYNDLVLFE